MRKVVLAVVLVLTFNNVVADDLPKCSGTSTIAQGIKGSKLFMALANGQKVQYSNEYGHKGTTKYTFKTPAGKEQFAVGYTVTYAGVLSQGICVPDVLTVVSK